MGGQLSSFGRGGLFSPAFLSRLGLAAGLLLLGGCADITRPLPTGPEVEAEQQAAVSRHPQQTWSLERLSRTSLKLLPTAPQVQGRTYPFLGFSWGVTATGKIMVFEVQYPSPAKEAELRQDQKVLAERGLKPGDFILAVNNWDFYPWLPQWDEYIHLTRRLFRDVHLTAAILRVFGQDARYYAYKYLGLDLGYYREDRPFPPLPLILSLPPGELLVAVMLDLKHLAMETRKQYLAGKVDLLLERQGEKYLTTLYPQHLPAEYAVQVDTLAREYNAWAAPGRIRLSQRLVSFCLNDHELALIVGHELAHHVMGHMVRRAGQRQLGEMAGRVVTGLATFNLTTLLDPKRIRLLPVFTGAGQEVVVSVFAADDEREADAYGLWYAYQAGYDPDKAVAVLERWSAVLSDPFERTEFLDSHPAPLERLARLKKIARYFKAGRAAEIFLQSPNLDRQPPP
jgi:Zn-dependent protease with chaperone function